MSKNEKLRESSENKNPIRDREPSIGSMIDQVCDQFEQAWASVDLSDLNNQKNRPRLEAYLDPTTDGAPDTAASTDADNNAIIAKTPEHRESLFRELLWVELSYLDSHARRKDDPQPELDAYVARFPDFSGVVHDVFEQLRNRSQIQSRRKMEPVDMSDRRFVCNPSFSRLRFHAGGGLGEVYRGRDEKLKRRVAVKFIRQDLANDPEASARFMLEAEVTSRLDHPGVVPVYAIGQDDTGRPFYVMRFIEGTDFRHAIDDYHELLRSHDPVRSKLAMHGLLRTLISACRTVAYAHNRGVLHRDIKPDNIMSGKYGETLVVDWGLVHFVERDEQAKASGELTLAPSSFNDSNLSSNSVAGTIGYLSPEQTPGGNAEIGPASDIYSLGATLYRVLTGASPFHHQQGNAVWDKILCGDFPRPKLLNSACPHDLEAVCLKAMASKPEDRYGSALEMADDLEHWLADEPVSVREQPVTEKLARFSRRHRTAARSLVGATVVVALVCLAMVFILADKASTESGLRRQVEASRLANLKTAASFAADGIGNELDCYWNALYESLYEPDQQGRTLYDLVIEAEGTELDSPEHAELDRWIEKAAWPWVNRKVAESWFVCDQSGVQLTRYPKSDSIGKSYNYRSYFQNKDYDLPPDCTEDQLRIIDRTTLSSPYIGTETGQLKVVFSIPVRKSPDDEPVGVIGIGADLGEQFTTFLEQRIGKDFVLVNLRQDSIEANVLRAGAIISHPMLEPGTDISRLESGLLKRMSHDTEQLVPDFVDPLNPTTGPHPAAIARVMVDFRDRGGCVQGYSPPVECGWAIIVQDSVVGE